MTDVAQRTVRALRVHRAGELALDPVPAPTAHADEAIVRIRYGGICGSDIHYWRDGAVGASRLRAAMTLGHEVVGTVAHGARDGSGPRVGEPVAIHPAQVCGVCRWCRAGEANLCPQLRYLGSAAQWPHTDGGFVDELAVATDRLVALPPGIELTRAGLAEPAAVAWHAVNRAAAIHGRVDATDVLVVGGGPIGLLVTAAAIDRGAATTTVVDVVAQPLRTARRIGASRTLSAAELADGEPLGCDISFESSGTVAGLRTALQQTRRGGSVVMVGQQPAGELPIPAGLIVTHELSLAGSLRIDDELGSALDFLARAQPALDHLITDVIGVDDALRAFELAADADRSTKVLLDFGA